MDTTDDHTAKKADIAAKQRIKVLEIGYDKLRTICNRQQAEIARLRAELASIEQFAESWPCHCAENYPGATMYHGPDCQTAVAVEFVAQWRAAKVKP